MTMKQRAPGGPWHIYLPPVRKGEPPLRMSTGLTDRKAAQRIHDELKAERARGRAGLAPSKQAGMALAEAHRFVLRNHWSRLKSPESAQDGYATWARLLGESTPLHEITQRAVMDAVHRMASEGLSGATINRKLAYLSKLRSYCEAHGGLEGLPRITFPHMPKAPFRPFVFSPEDERRMLDWFKAQGRHREALLCQWLVDTGMRLGEALRCEAAHVKGAAVEVWENKAAHPRTIPLTKRGALIASYSGGPAGRLFGDLSEDGFERAWAKMRAAVFPGVAERCSPHSLRHTCCTRLFQAGIDAARVQRWMGHKAIATTMLYAHLNTEDLEVAARALDRVHAVCTPEASARSVLSDVPDVTPVRLPGKTGRWWEIRTPDQRIKSPPETPEESEG